MDVLGVIGLIKEVYSHIKEQIPAFDNVYDRALRRWTKNSYLRRKYSENSLSDFDTLVRYVENESSVNPGLVNFFEILLDEAKKDPQVAPRLSAEYAISTNKKISALDEALSKIYDTLREALPHRPDLSVDYKDVEDYIPLTVNGDETEEARLTRILSGKVENKTLADLIVEGKKRLILFSHPQHGKSTVLAKLAFDLQSSGIYNPFLYSLRNYSSALSLVEQIKLDYRLGNSSTSVLILDGLDELKEEQREDVVSEIAAISTNYPLMSIVLSCRLSHKKVMTVSGFEAVYLQSMEYDALVGYVHSHSNAPESFLLEAQKSKLMRLLYVPFFLKESIKYFETNGHIPADEVTIYEYFINRSFEFDNARKANRTGSVSTKTRLYRHVEHMAFAMLASQRMEISPDELSECLGMSEAVIEQLVGLSLITRSENGELTFVHNAFKEYILAKKLAEFDEKQIKKMVCFPETDIIIPALKNVVVLLIHLLSKLDSWNSSGIKDWFIEKCPNVLVEVGSECLESNIREEIFEKIFNAHKIKGLHIDLWNCRSLMSFALTQKTAELVLYEIEHSEALDTNCFNALKLAEYADFSLLSSARKQHAEGVFLSLLDFNASRIGDYSYLSMPLINKSILSIDLIDRALEKVSDTKNCYLIQMICSMSVSLGVADKYAGWVLPKSQYVRNYDENGVTHVISNHDLLEFIRTLQKPENILEAIRILLPRQRCRQISYLENEGLDLVPELLATLRSCRTESYVQELIEIIDSAFMERIPRSVSVAFGSYFKQFAEVDVLFDRRLNEIIEIAGKKEKDFYSVWNMHNLLSVLLDGDILCKLIGEDIDGNFAIYNILSRLRNYAARSESELAIIDGFSNRKIPRESLPDSNQKRFDVLFDNAEFENEIYRIFGDGDKIDFDHDLERLYLSNYNSSVLTFLQEVKEDSEVVNLDEVLIAFRDSKKFAVFTAKCVSRSVDVAIYVSDDNKIKLIQIIRSLIPSCRENHGLAECLVNVIVRHDLLLPDDELMQLLPWSGVHVGQKHDKGFTYNQRNFIDHIHDNVKDKSLFISGIKSAVADGLIASDSFNTAVASNIIRNRISELYELFPDLVRDLEYDYDRVNIAINLLQLGRPGLIISKRVLNFLSETDKLYFYEHLLLHENKGLALSASEKSSALDYIESCYEIYSEHIKQRALRILFAYGRESALDWGFAMFDNCKTWMYEDNFPTISGYSGQYFARLAEYFRRATSGEQSLYSRPQPMYESVGNALKNIAMESKAMLGKVQALFREIAFEKKDFRYYNRVADELEVDYQSRNVPPPDLRQASLQYRSICQ